MLRLRLPLALAIILSLPTLAHAQSSPAPADLPITIGVLNNQTGGLADPAGLGSVLAAKMAVEDFGGTVLGKPIRLVSADQQNKPDVALAIARRWFDEGVDAIFDLPNTAVALGVQNLAAERKRIAIISTAGASVLTGASCTPNSVVWTYNTRALAETVVRPTVQSGGDTWYFISADYTFGHVLQQDVNEVLSRVGAKAVGSVAAPQETADFSSYLLQAQSSGAKVIALANVASDTVNSIKQAHEFGLTASGQKLAALLITLTDVDALGLETAQGLYLATAFYWDRTEASRAWAKRFFAQHGKMPTMMQAGVYSAVTHYLGAVRDTSSRDSAVVMARMKATPIHDMFVDRGVIRADGMMVHDMYLAQVKKPSEQRYPWDYYRIVASVPAEEVFGARPASDCKLASP